MKKNTAGQKIGAQMVSATDGSNFTGAVTVYVTGDAGTQAVGSVGSGACTHEGNGYHTYAPAQAETNYDLIAFTFIGTGAVSSTVQVETVTKLVSELNDIAVGAAMTLAADQAVNATKIGGVSQTGRDLGSSVLLSSGTGTGQLDFSSGIVKSNLIQILGTTLTETAGYIAAAFKQFFNVASPSGTMKAITNVVTATNLTNAPTNGDLTATMKTSVTTAATAATPNLNAAYNAAKTAAQAGDAMTLTSTYDAAKTAAPSAASNATAVRSELTAELGRIDASVSSRSTLSAGNVRTELTTELGRIDAAVSSRSTLAAGAAMTLTPGERISIGTAVWATTTRSLTTFGSLAADAATAVWGAVTRTLTAGPKDAAIDAIKAKTDTLSAPLDASATRAALGLATANLDTQLGALPTDADVQTAAAAALAASTVPGDAAATRAAVYDSATAAGDTITLSDGTTQAVSATGRVTTAP